MSEPIVAEPRSAYRRLPPIVVDCSVLAALLFDEPEGNSATRVLTGKSIFAPWLIDHEMISVGLKKARSGQDDVARQGLEALAQISMTRRTTNGKAQWQLARQENLSAYDAAYLQLAVELNAPLATYDQALGAAAERVLGGR